VAIDQDEEEQVEALKKWWDENGKSLVIGLVLGLGAVYGYREYEDSLYFQSQQASNAFEELRLLSESEEGKYQTAEIVARSEQLREQHATSAYADFAGLTMALAQINAGDAVAARATLESVVSVTSIPELKHMTQLRLARLLLGEGDLDAAIAYLDAVPETSFTSLRAELLGDIRRQQGDIEQARVAYITALAMAVDNQYVVLQMKLGDLGVVVSSPAGATE